MKSAIRTTKIFIGRNVLTIGKTTTQIKTGARMKIQVEVEIFDDLEYCSTSDQVPDFQCCKFLYHEEHEDKINPVCRFHSDVKGWMQDLESNNDEGRPEKCDECKKAYQETIGRIAKGVVLTHQDGEPLYNQG
jgi:hypothetical protein